MKSLCHSLAQSCLGEGFHLHISHNSLNLIPKKENLLGSKVKQTAPLPASVLCVGPFHRYGGCHKPPRYVQYKCTYVLYNGTFGTSD